MQDQDQKNQKQNHSTKFRFLIVGGLNTAIDFGLLFMLSSLFFLDKSFANIISTSVAFVFSFFANKKFTFNSSSSHIVHQMALFTVVTLFGLWVIQGIIIAVLTPKIVTMMHISTNLALLAAKLIATAASLVWNYILYSRVVFKK